ncbi:MAG: glycosyltransferase [Planctomycetota bacterium]
MSEPRTSATPPTVSVLMPTWQGMEFLARVLDALAAQRYSGEWDLLAIDSSSTDGTWELLGERAESFPVPMRCERIHGVEFDHGDTRNLLAARSRGEILVFLTQDAIPASHDWLQTLVANFDDPEVGAAYCRNVPRPDADVLTKVFSARDPGYAEGRRETRLPAADEYAAMGPHERRLLYNFNDVASAFRRDLWERHPFPRTPFGEDVLMARAFLEAGFTVVYDDVATVEHSHDYDEAENRARARIDARFNAEWLDRICVASRKDAAVLTVRTSEDDAQAIEALGLPTGEIDALVERARSLRAATFEGMAEGSQAARRRPATRMRDRSDLRLLYVVHGFPPETWAGTEIYTLNLAKEMQRRGHTVAVLTRSPGVGDEPEFSVREDEFEGLRVLRMTHRLDHANLRESFVNEGPEVAFRQVLNDFEPDLVHFQHLIHASIGLVEIARSRGMATVVTCHDYWALCPRVQMIRPGGEICPSNMGSGCFLCIKEKGLDQVELANRLDGALGAGKVLSALAETVKGLGLNAGGAGRRAFDFAALRERERVVPEAYAAADLRISPSRFLRDMYLASGAFEPHTFLFSDNGMRTDHVEALEKTVDPDGKVRFGFVGSLVWYKGGETLVRAMRALVDRGLGDRVHLHVYGGFDPGSDPHHAELAELADGAPVTFHGRFDNGRLSEVYADIDALVVPSLWYENSPITIHEAYLTGTPVLASDRGGMAEFVRDGVDGLLFELGSAEDLATKMARVVEEDGLLARLTSAEWIPIKTIEQNGEETEARYRSLCTIVRSSAGASADGGPVFDRAALDTTDRRGPCEQQGADVLLLRPGASADWDVGGVPSVPLSIEVEAYVHADEPDLEIGAQVLVDGRPAASIGPVSAAGSDAFVQLRADLDLDLEPGAAPKTLTLEPQGGDGAGIHLRLRRIRLSPTTASPQGSAIASR